MREYYIDAENLRFMLGESKEEIIDRLQKARLRYVTPFDGLADNSTVKETVLNIPELGVELMFENDIVTYIKSHNSTCNVVCSTDIGEAMRVNDIDSLIESVANKFNIDKHSIIVKSINLKRVDAILMIHDTKVIRVNLLCDLGGNVFISTLKTMPSS